MKYLIIIMLLVSSCGIRKVATTKTTTETKTEAVSQAVTDTQKIEVAKQIDQISDTSKIVAENKTIVEFFTDSGKVYKRITSFTKKQKHNYILTNKVKIDSTFQTTHSELKDSTVVTQKTTTKNKVTEAKRFPIGIAIALVALCALMVWIYTRK